MRSLPELEDDHRIRRLLNDFDKRYTGQDFNALQNKTSGAVTPEMLDGVKSDCNYFFRVKVTLSLPLTVVETILPTMHAAFTRDHTFNPSFETRRPNSIRPFYKRYRSQSGTFLKVLEGRIFEKYGYR